MLYEYGNLYVLLPLKFAGERLSEKKYLDACQRAVDNYKRKPDLNEFKRTDGYVVPLFRVHDGGAGRSGRGRTGEKRSGLGTKMEKDNGAIPSYPGVEWACSTGMAQLALAWYKLGITEPADKAMAHLATIQNPSGGFFGSYGSTVRGISLYQEI